MRLFILAQSNISQSLPHPKPLTLKAVGDWLCGYAEHKQPFDEIKHLHTLKEVGDVAEGAYDWKIEKGQRSLISM